jgi:hypothetical protein
MFGRNSPRFARFCAVTCKERLTRKPYAFGPNCGRMDVCGAGRMHRVGSRQLNKATGSTRCVTGHCKGVETQPSLYDTGVIAANGVAPRAAWHDFWDSSEGCLNVFQDRCLLLMKKDVIVRHA